MYFLYNNSPPHDSHGWLYNLANVVVKIFVKTSCQVDSNKNSRKIIIMAGRVILKSQIYQIYIRGGSVTYSHYDRQI